MARLQLKKVVKSYPSGDVIRGVDLDIDDREFVVFVGPSGCGKSTLLRMISGLESVSSGEIIIDDQCVNDIPAAQRGLAMVFQSYALYPHMTVYQNLAFGLENIRTPRDTIAKKIAEAAKMLQIDHLLDRKPTALSGGQRQRVAIGRAIVREPKIFLFDEPLSNLDAELRVQMRAEISQLHRQLGNTMIYVTHDQVEAMTMADKIVVLRSGNIEQVGAPLDLYNRPENRFVAGFIGSPKMNFLPGVISSIDSDGVQVKLDGDEEPTILARVDGAGRTDGEKVTVGIRPEHIHVPGDQSTGRTAAPNGGNTVKLAVKHTEQLGSESYLFAELSGGKRVVVHLPGQTSARIGDIIDVQIPAPSCHIFQTDRGEMALPRLDAPIDRPTTPQTDQ
ncbi:MAG: sn-glycerol-3-phosphate ABC transporter ATP-binding protein UgpC [Proteobacteria bacterium]|nr:sn-glycerol-3-phosphate ABC transporter ATP-binding protein UgpC [Pseudomonadota bacterium]